MHEGRQGGFTQHTHVHSREIEGVSAGCVTKLKGMNRRAAMAIIGRGVLFDICDVKNYEEGGGCWCSSGPHGCCRWFFHVPLNSNPRRHLNNEKRYLEDNTSEVCSSEIKSL